MVGIFPATSSPSVTNTERATIGGCFAEVFSAGWFLKLSLLSWAAGLTNGICTFCLMEDFSSSAVCSEVRAYVPLKGACETCCVVMEEWVNHSVFTHTLICFVFDCPACFNSWLGCTLMFANVPLLSEGLQDPKGQQGVSGRSMCRLHFWSTQSWSWRSWGLALCCCCFPQHGTGERSCSRGLGGFLALDCTAPACAAVSSWPGLGLQVTTPPTYRIYSPASVLAKRAAKRVHQVLCNQCSKHVVLELLLSLLSWSHRFLGQLLAEVSSLGAHSWVQKALVGQLVLSTPVSK